MIFCTSYIHNGAQRMNPNYFGGLLTFNLASKFLIIQRSVPTFRWLSTKSGTVIYGYIVYELMK